MYLPSVKFVIDGEGAKRFDPDRETSADFGFDSLDELGLVVEIEDEFEIVLQDSDLDGVTTLTQLIDLVEKERNKMTDVILTATVVKPTAFSVECPHCKQAVDGWQKDPRGLETKCDWCKQPFAVHPDADFEP